MVPGGRVPLLIGGNGAAAVRRTIEYGDGWTVGGAPPDQVAPMVQRIRQAWTDAGKAGAPRILALTYYSLGDEVEESSFDYLRHYYATFGQYAEMIANGALRSEDAVRGALDAYAEAGVDEVIFDPTVADLAQIDRLAKIVL